MIYPGQPRTFGSDYTHDVRNASIAPAISIHTCSPPLNEMNKYDLDGSRLVPHERSSEWVDVSGRERTVQRLESPNRPPVSSIEQMLSAARARLRRLCPHEVYDAAARIEAVFVDIRPEGLRAAEGSIPGTLLVGRNVLEWRFDPATNSRLPIATVHDLQVIVFCSEGYTSSLAAAALQDLGLWRATDMAGGFHAWRAAGLPIESPRSPGS